MVIETNTVEQDLIFYINSDFVQQFQTNHLGSSILPNLILFKGICCKWDGAIKLSRCVSPDVDLIVGLRKIWIRVQ
jgi:hypothetical protein